MRLILASLDIDTGATVARGAWEVVDVTTFSSDEEGAASGEEENEKIPSTITISIKVRRYPDYYRENVVLPMFILSVCASFVVLLPPTDVSDRVMASVTLILAFIAFQYVMNESIPQTGCQTRLHKLVMYSQCLISLVLAESILIFYVHKWITALREEARRIRASLHGKFHQNRSRRFSKAIIKSIIPSSFQRNSAYTEVDRIESNSGHDFASKPNAPPPPLTAKINAIATKTKVHPFDDDADAGADDRTQSSSTSTSKSDDKNETPALSFAAAAVAAKAVTKLKRRQSAARGALEELFSYDVYFFIALLAATLSLYALFLADIL